MKKILTLLVLLISTTVFSQVGIGNTAPQGALDITSTTDGLLIPRVALVATNIATVVTPTTSELVYNTATSAIGPNQVIPGFYYYNGTIWVPFVSSSNAQVNTFTQTANVSTNSQPTNFTNITGLSSVSFVGAQAGIYQVVFHGYLGANILTSGDFGHLEGLFKLTVNGVDSIKYMHAESFNRGSSDFYELFNEVTIVYNVTLTAGATCTLNASYRGVADSFINNPPHIVGSTALLGDKCEIIVTYVGK